jgi:hypothetical protein
MHLLIIAALIFLVLGFARRVGAMVLWLLIAGAVCGAIGALFN